MKGYTINKLYELKLHTEVLRACPQITFEAANLINKNHLIVSRAIDEYTEKAKLLNERGKALKQDDEEGQAQMREDILTLNTEVYNVELTPVSSSSFTDISGDKEVVQNDGTLRKFSYRDAYFSLLGEIITE